MSSIAETREHPDTAAAETNGRRKPLFPFWVLVAIAAVIEVAILLLLWPVFAISGWSVPTVAALTALNLLGVYVIGELIRQRLRMSVRMLLLVVAFVGFCCALFVSRLVEARQQRQAFSPIAALGGYARHGIDGGYGDWFQTEQGFMLPKWVLDWCGEEFFAEVENIWFSQLVHMLTDEELKQIDFHQFPQLTELSFWNVPITAEGLAHIGELRQLTALGLAGTPTTDAGLAELASLTKMERLNLGDTKITDAGLVHLRDMSNLDSLWLRNTAITDAGLKELHRHKQLKYIGLKGTLVTPKGREELQKALPGCNIWD